MPLQETIIPLFWIEGGTRNAVDAQIEQTLRDDPLTKSVERLTEADGRVLYEVHWDFDVNGPIQALIDADAQLLQAEGAADVWDFRLQFRSRDALVQFRQACNEQDIPITLRRLYNPQIPEEDGRLTDNQYEALVRAYQEGYFEVPRETSMDALAAEFGISNSAISQRIRRGTSALIAEALLQE